MFTTSCSSDNSLDFNKPNIKLAQKFHLDSINLMYQYYQKFGFHETCEDLRMVSKAQKKLSFKKDLPISLTDLKIINDFSNKADQLKGDKISFSTNTRNVFYDIEIDYVNYTNDSLLQVGLSNGSYELKHSDLNLILKVYDKDSDLYYIEMHQCDR